MTIPHMRQIEPARNRNGAQPATIVDATIGSTAADAGDITYVTFHLDHQLFGFRIEDVQEVFTTRQITRVPLAPPAIRGLLTMRGRIVTAICLRSVLGMAATADPGEQFAISVDFAGETFALLVDGIGEVMKLPMSSLEAAPIHLDPKWRDMTRGVHRLETSVLVSLDIERLIASQRSTA